MATIKEASASRAPSREAGRGPLPLVVLARLTHAADVAGFAVAGFPSSWVRPGCVGLPLSNFYTIQLSRHCTIASESSRRSERFVRRRTGKAFFGGVPALRAETACLPGHAGSTRKALFSLCLHACSSKRGAFMHAGRACAEHASVHSRRPSGRRGLVHPSTVSPTSSQGETQALSFRHA